MKIDGSASGILITLENNDREERIIYYSHYFHPTKKCSEVNCLIPPEFTYHSENKTQGGNKKSLSALALLQRGHGWSPEIFPTISANFLSTWRIMLSAVKGDGCSSYHVLPVHMCWVYFILQPSLGRKMNLFLLYRRSKQKI